jgi:hypothetical protein
MAVETRRPDWRHLLYQALTAPGNLGNTYSRFHDYSFTNEMLFFMQGIHEPVASCSTWKALGRTILVGDRRKEVIVPKIVKVLAPKTVKKRQTRSVSALSG